MRSLSEILFVDDDADDQALVTDAIRQLAPMIRVSTAANGEEALAYLEQAKQEGILPSLILLDINMPLLNGKKTLVRIKEDPVLSGLTVVIFTSSPSKKDEEYCLEYGAADFITKPFHYDELRQTVRRFIALLVARS